MPAANAAASVGALLPHRRVPLWQRHQKPLASETVTLKEVEAAREQTQRAVEPPRFG